MTRDPKVFLMGKKPYLFF